jgi:hypothetical protein
VPVEPVYIEQIFSPYLYTGNGSTQTITNGIDLSTKGGLVWTKSRTTGYSHSLIDTVRGTKSDLRSNGTDAALSLSSTAGFSSFDTSGYSIAGDFGGWGSLNASGEPHVSWTFRKQPKFFDVVTVSYSGTAITVNHGLGSVPGCIILKQTDGVSIWRVYHRSVTGVDSTGALNSTLGFASPNGYSNFASSITSTSFTFDAGFPSGTYVAYLFAHDAGGFGTAGTDNVISCGSFSGASLVTLGYEPQWVLSRRIDTAGDWRIFDTMRGFDVSAGGALLSPNRSDAETVGYDIRPSATGFTPTSFPSGTNIYIAIRRGPMKVPTLGTSVFSLSQFSASATNTGSSVLTDLVIAKNPAAGKDVFAMNRLAGTLHLTTSTSNGEGGTASQGAWNVMTGFRFTASANSYTGDFSSSAQIAWQFKRAPSFCDVVCYAGTGTSAAQAHNLGVTPEWVICKDRTGATFPDWGLWSAGDGIVNHDISGLSLNLTAGATYIDLGYSSRFTATTFRPDTVYDTGGNGKNQSGHTYVAYLFATCAGVSKVGYYVGTGTLTTINCGFVAGARFVIIKNVSSTGGWYVWDSTRGMVSGTDPSLQLNSAAAESNADSVYAVTTGFQLLASPAVAVNTNLAKYIFLAIA